MTECHSGPNVSARADIDVLHAPIWHFWVAMTTRSEKATQMKENMQLLTAKKKNSKGELQTQIFQCSE